MNIISSHKMFIISPSVTCAAVRGWFWVSGCSSDMSGCIHWYWYWYPGDCLRSSATSEAMLPWPSVAELRLRPRITGFWGSFWKTKRDPHPHAAWITLKPLSLINEASGAEHHRVSWSPVAWQRPRYTAAVSWKYARPDQFVTFGTFARLFVLGGAESWRVLAFNSIHQRGNHETRGNSELFLRILHIFINLNLLIRINKKPSITPI